MSSREESVRRKRRTEKRDNGYIQPSLLPNLKKYKYAGADYSILSNTVGQPFWNFVVSLVPMKIAPNIITLTGFIAGMSAFVLVAFYTFFGACEYPSWLWLYCGASLFAYQTLDAIDGKQARRTGSGSPLGELFDHGCDAFLTPFVQLNLGVATKMSPPLLFVFMLSSSLGLFSAIFEQYCTGIFDLGYISGPTEGIVLSCSLFTVAGLFTRDVFDRVVVGPYDVTVPPPVASLFSSSLFSSSPFTITIGTLRSVLITVFLSSWVVTTLSNYAHTVMRPSVHQSRVTPLVALLPIVLITVLHITLYRLYPDVQSICPFALELSFGLLMSITVTRLTVSRLSIGKYRPFSFFYMSTLVVTAAAIIVHYTGAGSVPVETVHQCVGYALAGLAVLGAVNYAYMITSIFNQVAQFLGIHIFSITPKKTE